jgi:hypothetical protein
VIDLHGNKKYAKAVLRIGSLTLISTPSLLGHECYILDKKRTTCVSSESVKAGIYIDGELHEADEKGLIIISYAQAKATTQAILIYGKLAQFVNFERLTEEYSLKHSFFVFPESFLINNQATVAIRPFLYINKHTAPATLIQSAKVDLEFTTVKNNITVTKTFENLEVKDNSDTIIKFEVPSGIVKVSMKFKGEVKKTLVNLKQVLEASYEIPIETHKDDNIHFEVYMQLIGNNEYQLLALGKNGEPISGLSLELNFTCNKLSRTVYEQAETDKQGVVKLGTLKDITYISLRAEANSSVYCKSWTIGSRNYVNYPHDLDILDMIALLREQQRFILYHKRDDNILKEYSDSKTQLKKELGSWFESYLISTDKEDMEEHKEYYPLSNPRVHNIVEGATLLFAKPKLYKIYKSFIVSLAEKNT